MKIIKDSKTGLLLKSFLLDNQDYLSLSIFYYFDLNNPNSPLPEKSMYRETAKQLGKTLLDYAMPKPKAEVLLSGFCHNTTPESGASHVVLKVGDTINKELYVFGERRWNNTLITKPLPFTSMPLDYAHATPKDNLLPNVEDPKHLITTKGEEIEPASYMPKDIHSPQNMKKLGTFNEHYKITQWPGFAEDMDYTFFNVAPDGQTQENFFEGGEIISMLNMHPKKQLFTSTLPQTGFRCFITREHSDKEDEFQEIILQRDTLWLFPEIERGIVIFRGTLKVADEIYSDIKYLNIKPLFPGDTPKSIDEYYELQKKELDRSVEIDQRAFEQADKEIAEAEKELFDIPRQMKETADKGQGKKPHLKTSSEQKLKESHKRLDNAISRMQQANKKLQELKELFGHKVKIDENGFDSAIEEFLETKQKISSGLQKLKNAQKETEQVKADALNKIKTAKENTHVTNEMREELNTNFLQDKEKKWEDFAFEFLCDSVHNLNNSPQEIQKLKHLGFAERTLKRSWFGFNAQEQQFPAEKWKLKSDNDIFLPKGLLTARFEQTTLKALRIDGKLVLGSDKDYELFLSEENYNFPLFYFKDELEAWLCDQEAFDICNSLVCEDISAVGNEAKEALKKASVIFYLEEDGVIEKLPQAKRFDCKEYKNLFQLHQNAIEIREQIIQNLPKNIQEELPIKREVTPKAIMKRASLVTDKVQSETKAEIDKVKKELEDESKELEKKMQETIKKYNLDIDKSHQETPPDGMDPAGVAKYFDNAIKVLQQENDKNGIDVESEIKKFQEMKEEFIGYAKTYQTRYAQAREKLDKAKKTNVSTPEWAKKMMQDAGIDPDNPHPKNLTREDVIELYKEGASFKHKNLSNLDLSELNLNGIDLRGANCKKTDFSQTNLSGANLRQTNFTDALMIQTDFSNAKVDMTLFKKTKLHKALFDNTVLHMALFNKCDLKGAQFNNASIQGVIFQELDLENVIMKNCDVQNFSFIKSSLKNVDFGYSKIQKAIFSKATLDDCSFAYLDSRRVLFNKSTATRCDFSRAKLQNFRLLKQSRLHLCDLSYTHMQKSTLFEATIDECNLQKAEISKSLIKKTEIIKCDFKGAIAKGSRFEYANAQESSFIGINLLRGSLRRMDLKICDFSHANLYGVEFYKTKFYEVNLANANLKRSNLEDRVEFIND